jgi:hypothetical protein
MSKGGRSRTEIEARRALRRASTELDVDTHEEEPLSCLKVPYATEDAALRAKLPGIPHKCWCGSWHLTTSGRHHGRRGRP